MSDVSHQTKTPVANIRLYSQLLAEEPLSAQGAECAAVIAAQAEKLDGLIQGLVKSSRLETGILALHPRETVLAPLVRSAASQYAAKAEAAGVALSLGETAGCAVCDPKWTEEALCNLLDNAIKYTPAGGNVQLDVVCYPMFCALRVRDDGPGIAESEQAKIFARFYRARTPTTSLASASGFIWRGRSLRVREDISNAPARPAKAAHLRSICRLLRFQERKMNHVKTLRILS